MLYLLAVTRAHWTRIKRVRRTVERGDFQAARFDFLQSGVERAFVGQETVRSEMRRAGPTAASHLDSFDAQLDALVEHVGEGEIAHHIGADGKFHIP